MKNKLLHISLFSFTTNQDKNCHLSTFYSDNTFKDKKAQGASDLNIKDKINENKVQSNILDKKRKVFSSLLMHPSLCTNVTSTIS